MKYCGLLLCVAGIAAAQELTVQHAECSLFGANMAKAGRTAAAGRRPELSALTTLVAAVLPAPPGPISWIIRSDSFCQSREKNPRK